MQKENKEKKGRVTSKKKVKERDENKRIEGLSLSVAPKWCTRSCQYGVN